MPTVAFPDNIQVLLMDSLGHSGSSLGATPPVLAGKGLCVVEWRTQNYAILVGLRPENSPCPVGFFFFSFLLISM